MEEIWKDVIGYEGIYQVSNLGNVKSFKWNKEKILNPGVNSGGYLTVNLCLNSKQKNYKVHKLVAIHFLGHKPCGHKLVIHHINDVKLDNSVNNLQLITQRENSRKNQSNYKSKYKGVTWSNVNKKWRVRMQINKKEVFLGNFINEYEAHLAYQNKLKEL